MTPKFDPWKPIVISKGGLGFSKTKKIREALERIKRRRKKGK